MDKIYTHFNSTTTILFSLSIILFSGFLVTRLTKKLGLPNVSGYIIAGVLIGPYCLRAVPESVVADMGFISDIALAFIAFGVGKFFKKEVLRETGGKVILITLFEALAAGIAVTLSLHYLFSLDWNFSLLLGAVATATAPASTMMTINQYHARGPFVNTLLQVVAFDDVVCLLVFSIVTAAVSAGNSGEVSASDILLPIAYNVLALVLGFLCGLILSKIITPSRSQDNRLIIVVAMLLGISGLCSIFDVSPLLSCMVFGTTYINLTRDKELYRQLNHFTPPIMSIFFIVSGMNLNLGMLGTFGLIGLAYYLIRIVGKYGGAFLGCVITKTDVSIRNYLGLALIPQAGVAIGLAFLGQRMLSGEMGDLFLTIILASSVLYELTGPACAKAALIFSGAIKKEQLKPTKHTPPIEEVQVQQIGENDPSASKKEKDKKKKPKVKMSEI